MKKILVIGLSSILGGVETYIYNLVRFSDKTKFNYYFLIIGNKKSVFEDEINDLFNDKENHFYYCPNIKKNFFKGIKWLKTFYKKNKFDYIYMNTCTCAKFLYCISALKMGTKLISHSHSGNSNVKNNNVFFRPFVNKYSYKKLACSDLAGKWLYGDKSNDYTIIPNGVDTDRFRFNNEIRKRIRNEFKIKNDDIVIGHIGRFSEEKNHMYFIDLALKLQKKYKFLLIGDGELKDKVFEKIKEFNLLDRFIILPSSISVEKYYNAMDIFAMPSIYEGLPIVSVEAQTNGLNCLFSDNVSRNSDLSNHCKFISLDDQNEWIESIIDLDLKRYDGVKEIKNRHFDISSTIKMIENIISK